MCASADLSGNHTPREYRAQSPAARRLAIERRRRVLANRHDWASIALDRARARLDAVHAEMAELDALESRP